MAYQNLQLRYDSSTLASWKEWCKAISDFFRTCGWIQCDNTGQVVWEASVAACTAVSMSGTAATYTHTLTSGPALRVGMSVVITGMQNSANNLTATITALGSGTFTVVNASGVNESNSSGSASTTAVAAVPTNAWVYEIWRPGDAGTVFYVKLQYGYSTTQPGLWYDLAQGTNGAGALTGKTAGAGIWGSDGRGPNGAGLVNMYDCHMSGDTSSIMVMMWRNGGGNMPIFFCIERSHDANGDDTNEAAFFWKSGMNSDGNWAHALTVLLLPGIASWTQTRTFMLPALVTGWGSGNGELGSNYASMNGTVPVLPNFPYGGGKIHPPSKRFCWCYTGQWAEGVKYTFNDSYGDLHQWMYSYVNPWSRNNGHALMVRVD